MLTNNHSRTGATGAPEATVTSHGLSYPHNLRLVLRLEEIVREGGAAPATVDIIAGEIGGILFR